MEAIPPNALPLRRKEVDLCMFIDSDHAGKKQTRRSKTRFMYMNMSLIIWYSKRQSTIETSVFGAEFVAMKVRIKALNEIWSKLKMMSIPKSRASFVYGDSISVIHNTSKPESTLKRKCDAIACHAIHESVATGETLTGHIREEDNTAHFLTKTLTGHRCLCLVSLVLYDIYDRDT